jgi:hypothetical protein
MVASGNAGGRTTEIGYGRRVTIERRRALAAAYLYGVVTTGGVGQVEMIWTDQREKRGLGSGSGDEAGLTSTSHSTRR